MNTIAPPIRFFTICLFAALIAARPSALARAADHLDAPGLTSPGGDGRVDITDVYAFQSPSTAADTVLILDVDPLAGIVNPTTFHPDADYDIKIDTNGDAKEDLTYRANFSQPDNMGVQTMTLRLIPAKGKSAVVAKGPTGSTLSVKGGGMVRAGLFDDPFFLDVDAFLGTGGRTFCDGAQVNFFGGLNVLSIVLEVPSTRLGTNTIGVCGRTALNNQQIDRMGRPLVNGALIPIDQKNAFNAGQPRNDTRDFSGTLNGLSTVFLPDVLAVDTSSTAGFFNGRRPDDDVVDIELPLITGGAITTDCIGNDSAITTTFPYLAPPNT